MKKLILLLLSLCFSFCFVGCGDGVADKDNNFSDGEKIEEGTNYTVPEVKDKNYNLKLKYLETYLKDYPDATVDNIMIFKDYGQYGNARVVIIYDGYYDYISVESQETIKGLVFTYGSSNAPIVFDGTHFYNLKEAYLNSILTFDDLQELNKQFISSAGDAKELHGDPIE